jgi:hypothetical protein
MGLLEFLRKSNDKGEIIQYLRASHKRDVIQKAYVAGGGENNFEQFRKQLLASYKQHVGQEHDALTLAQFTANQTGSLDIVDLEAYANSYTTRGEKLIATGTYSKFNDKYFGQWLVLHKPFRQLEEFHSNAMNVIERVPERYRNFALALHYAPEFWNDDAAIKEEMELEANSKAHVLTVLSKVHAQRHLVKRSLSGELSPTDAATSEEEDSDAEPVQGNRHRVKLTRSQKKLKQKMSACVLNSINAMRAENDEEHERCIDNAGSNKMIFGKGTTWSLSTRSRC